MNILEPEKNEIISDIILALRSYALGDIKENIRFPLTAFTLACCFLDQLAGFVYNSDHNNRMRKLISQYLSRYSSMNLDDVLRNNLLHNYSLDGDMRLAWEEVDFDNDPDCKNLNILNLTNFVADIEAVFEELVMKFQLIGSVERENAIEWDKKHPIFRHQDYNIPVYSSEEADHLINYYSKKMVQRPLNKSSDLIVEELDKKYLTEKNKYFIRVIAKRNRDHPLFWRELNDAIKFFKGLQLKSPKEILDIA
jgi:hypothetical protein